MKHLGTKCLETERLILRRFTMEDDHSMFQNWASDIEVTKFLVWPPHENIGVTRAVLADWVSHYAEENYYQWAIVPKELGEPIGSISAVHQNDRVGSVEIGYCIGKNWWHRGFMSEALGEVIRFFFREVGVNRVESRHDSNNPNSGAVMRKCGMVYEGTTRRGDWNNQGVCDACRYGILNEEYQG